MAGFPVFTGTHVVAAHFAVRLALIVFAVAEIRGAIEGSSFVTATRTALLAGGIFFLLGLCVGELAARVAEESARREFEQRLAEIQAGQGSPASPAESN